VSGESLPQQVRPGALVVPNPLAFESFVWLYSFASSAGEHPLSDDVPLFGTRWYNDDRGYTGLVVATGTPTSLGDTVTVLLAERMWLVYAARVKIVGE
jgi:hypothetical protein